MRFGLMFLAAAAAWAQPHAGYLYPAGGRQGASIEVLLGGQNLADANNAYISGAGVRVSVVEYVRPMTQAQANTLRETLQELNKKRTETPAKLTLEDRVRIDDIRDTLAKFVRRPQSAAIAEVVRLHVEIAGDAAPGERVVRVATPQGMTNPLTFCVGKLPEIARKPAEAWTAPGAVPAGRGMVLSTAAKPPEDITLPVTINGQIMPGAVDRYRFQGVKGQRIVAEADARELIPYISDAVPGWFQALLSLRDASGREVRQADHYRFHPDPVLEYEIPSDGTYTLEIHDSIYRGREDFVYRVCVGELPWVTGVFPLGGRAGTKTAVELRGWNLPSTRLTPDTRGQSGVLLLRSGDSNGMPFAVGDLPELREKEGNDSRSVAQRVKTPVIVNGRIDRPGDQDWFRFDGKAGEEIVLEVMARRLNSPVDSTLRLLDSQGREVAANDDADDQSDALSTHHADSRILCKLPSGGTYYAVIADAQKQGGPEFGYRLRISRPRPDYELRVTPASITARAGGAVPVTIYAIRRDGFAGEISLNLKDAPAGFGLEGGLIPAGTDSVRVTLSAPPGRLESPHQIAVEGHAQIDGRDVRRQAVAAEDMMQAFYYHHLVPADQLLVRVLSTQPVQWRPFPEKTQVRLTAGGSARLTVPMPARRVAEDVQFSLNQAPEGITVGSVAQSRTGLEVTLKADAKVKPGLKGNLILEAYVERNVNAKQAARRKQPLGMLPAVAFEVVK